MKRRASERLYRRGLDTLVGAVNSPVRAFRAVGGNPLFIARGKGSKIWDADGNSYVDYVCSWGALILGHANHRVLEATSKAAKRGTSFGAPTEAEVSLAEKVRSRMPSVEMLRLVSSGTEAAMSALRLARAYAKKTAFIKFEGCYHGHADPFLARAGSGVATFNLPASPGVTAGTIADTLTLQYNDPGGVEEAFKKWSDRIAAVIVEPVAANMGVVPPEAGFLEKLRRLCTENGSVLIFDEVVTGFRVSPGGAQELYGVRPDLTCLGKVLGGGFPSAAYGGRREIMEMVSPEGPVYQAGTLSGNPVAVAAGLATLGALNRRSYDRLETVSRTLQRGLVEAASAGGVEVTLNRVGSMFATFFGTGPVRTFTEVKGSAHASYPEFFWAMLERGIYTPPSAFESNFVSLAHGEADLEKTVAAARGAFRELGPSAMKKAAHTPKIL